MGEGGKRRFLGERGEPGGEVPPPRGWQGERESEFLWRWVHWCDGRGVGWEGEVGRSGEGVGCGVERVSSRWKGGPEREGGREGELKVKEVPLLLLLLLLCSPCAEGLSPALLSNCVYVYVCVCVLCVCVCVCVCACVCGLSGQMKCCEGEGSEVILLAFCV